MMGRKEGREGERHTIRAGRSVKRRTIREKNEGRKEGRKNNIP
jgi:hypothetical protein